MENNLTKTNRKTSAILFADIVAYSAIIESDEKRGLDTLRKFKQILEQEVPVYQGKIIHFYGDGCLAIFESSVYATSCSHTMQRIFTKEPRVPVRIGLHVGDVIIEEGNIYGDAVNMTSRIESLGTAGSVLMSDVVKATISNQEQFEFKALGRFAFKNIRNEMSVYALTGQGLTLPDKIPYGSRGSPIIEKKSKINSYLTVITILLTLYLFVKWINWGLLS